MQLHTCPFPGLDSQSYSSIQPLLLEHLSLLSTHLVKNVINEMFCYIVKGKNRGKFWNRVMDFLYSCGAG